MPTSPGWFPDPSGAPQQRFFDGNGWTDEVRVYAVPGAAPAPNEAPKPDAKPDKPQVSKKATAIGCGVFLLIGLGMAIGVSSCMASASNQAPTGPNAISAKLACQGMIKEKLKAPDTAKFSGDSMSGSGNDWTVVGSVDSQNSFGADLRSSYSCTITYNPADQTWSGSAVVG